MKKFDFSQFALGKNPLESSATLPMKKIYERKNYDDQEQSVQNMRLYRAAKRKVMNHSVISHSQLDLFSSDNNSSEDEISFKISARKAKIPALDSSDEEISKSIKNNHNFGMAKIVKSKLETPKSFKPLKKSKKVLTDDSTVKIKNGKEADDLGFLLNEDSQESFEENLKRLQLQFPTIRIEDLDKTLKECSNNMLKTASMIRKKYASILNKKKNGQSQGWQENNAGIWLTVSNKNYKPSTPKRKNQSESEEEFYPRKKTNFSSKKRVELFIDSDDSKQNDVNEKNNKKVKNLADDFELILDNCSSEEENGEFDYESEQNVLDSDDDEENEDKKIKSSLQGKNKKESISVLREDIKNLLNNALESELINIPLLTKAKYQQILNLRPFKDWSDLKIKFESSASLNLDLLENCQQHIKIKNVISNLMEQCQKISNKIKTSVSNLQEFRQPKILSKKLQLKSYQLIGLNWLVIMHQKQINGILADEMGLGKTVQVISLLAYLREKEGLNGPHLIVVPSSILANWKREFEMWCPCIKILNYYGNQVERSDLRHMIINKEIDFDVVITTYNMLYSNDDKKLLTRTKFQYVIFDEAHMLKNMKSSRFKNLFAVKSNYRLMLTGTPIQNNLLELMSLLIFTMPNLFYSKINYMESFFKSQKIDLNQSEFVVEKIDQAKEILKPFILRRIKENVLKDLPNKTEKYETIKMVERQSTLYNDLVQKYTSEMKYRKELRNKEKSEKKNFLKENIIDEKRIKKIDDNSGSNPDESSNDTIFEDEYFGKENVKFSANGMLMDLRKCANHPLLIRDLYNDEKLKIMAKILKKEEPYYQKDGNIKYMIEDMQILNDFDLHMLCKKFSCINHFKLDDKMILNSGKFIYLDKILLDLKNDKKRVLIFSQFNMMLDIIEEYLKLRNYKSCRLDGSTKVSDRMSIIDDFYADKDIFVFLLTTRAGGVGINLVEANNVIIHDVDFNPYNDKQAEDRVHRMGQTQDVNVYKLISMNSIEESMRDMCLNKLSIGKKITADNIDNTSQVDEKKSDIKHLLKLALKI